MINEHDIKDFPGSPYEPKKLYELQQGSYFRIDDVFASNMIYRLIKLDGMYSVCTDPDDIVMHFHIGTPVIEVKV